MNDTQLLNTIAGAAENALNAGVSPVTVLGILEHVKNAVHLAVREREEAQKPKKAFIRPSPGGES